MELPAPPVQEVDCGIRTRWGVMFGGAADDVRGERGAVFLSGTSLMFFL